jgi:putative transcriptional regulator
LPLPDAVTVLPGIHVGSSPVLLQTLAERTDIPVMVFAGYAGWGPGQLESELQRKSWLPSFGDIDADLVFATAPGSEWEAALAKMSLSPGHIVSGSGASA